MQNHKNNKLKIDAMFFTATEEPLKLLGNDLTISDIHDFKFNLLSGKIFIFNLILNFSE
jgi:hypothetical protein